MFKEAFVGVLILFIFYLLCRTLRAKKPKALSLLAFAVIAISCAANLIYNAVVMFPDFYMDTVSGVFRYGTFRGNLFAYSDEFMFQDTILFPILRNRSVALDESARFYEKFFSLYARDCVSLSPSGEDRQAVFSRNADFSFSHEFSCIGIMDYVKEEIPDELKDSFEEEIYPTVSINLDSLRGASALVVIMDTDYTVYVMGEPYYQEITGGNGYA